MNDSEIRAQLKRALGREIDGPAERRLAQLFGAVLVGGGQGAQQGFLAACTIYETMMARGQLPAAPILRPRPPGG